MLLSVLVLDFQVRYGRLYFLDPLSTDSLIIPLLIISVSIVLVTIFESVTCNLFLLQTRVPFVPRMISSISFTVIVPWFLIFLIILSSQLMNSLRYNSSDFLCCFTYPH